MPPIPVHIDDPITPTRPQGITPQTAALEPVIPSPATNVATTTTAAAAQPSGYPAARPAAAIPAPTPYIPIPQAPATRTTSTLQNENRPPPAQPGAVPVPFQQQQQQQASSGLPPPPRAGETAKTQQGSAFTGALNTMHTPPPPLAAAQHIQQNYAPTHSTSTTTSMPTTSQRAGPTTLDYGPVASPLAGGGYRDHGADARRVSADEQGARGGYVQNVYAQEMSSAQRASLEEEVRRESFVDKLGLGGVVGGGGAGGGSGGSGGSGGFGGTGREGEGRGGEGLSGVMDAARGWFGKAGTAIAEGEQEVWRRINGH